jgi:hypothetical protein
MNVVTMLSLPLENRMFKSTEQHRVGETYDNRGGGGGGAYMTEKFRNLMSTRLSFYVKLKLWVGDEGKVGGKC